MFRTLLETCDDFMTIQPDPASSELTAHIDRLKIATHGKPAIGQLALKLHIFRCTADVDDCRKFYEALTNIFLEDGEAVLKEYPETVEGMIQSWAERSV